MKKIAAIFTCSAVLVLGLVMLFGNSSDHDTPMPESAQYQTPAEVKGSQEALAELQVAEPPAEDNFPITKEQFESLPVSEQQEVLEVFAANFWEDELDPVEMLVPERKYLPLDIFDRVHTITEREFSQLSPEDQEKAMNETNATLRGIRSHAFGIIDQAKESMANSDYPSTEAGLIYGLEMGRELSANRESLIITRLVGIAVEKVALNEMVKLYTKTGEFSKVQIAQEQLQDIELEVEDIKNTAKEFEANR